MSRTVSRETERAQALASDPSRSVFVSANAGSGKTHVLTERVVRLLLAGAEPSKILCLTYTKAAAAEMQTRVFRRLAGWTRLPDAALAEELARMEPNRPAAPERLAEARRLFARALETPGGLKIQTIHAFCEAVLHQFPLEANIPGHFEVLDETESALLLAEARRLLVTGTRPGSPDPEDGALALAFADALAAGGEWGLDALLTEIVAKRDRVRGFIEGAGGLEEAIALTARSLGIDPAATAETALAAVNDPPGFDRDFRRALSLAAGDSDKATDATLLGKLADFESAATAQGRFEALGAILLTAAGERRKPGSVATKAVASRFPDFAERLAEAGDALDALAERLATLRLFSASRAALRIAERLDADYQALKRRRGRLDFEDLIVRTADLLLRGEAAAWVHFKLDQGIDHVLVDEAQDTSPRQWQVVRQLVEEFFGEAQARPRPRTVFAVGDEKQSIYSFQGASPAMFAAERRNLEALAKNAGLPFSRVELHQSFRSVPAVLDAVDRVFSGESDRRGLSSGNERPVHVSARASDPGLIEVWPSLVPAAVVASDDWLDPIDHQPASAPPSRLARRIAETIRRWIGQPVRVRGETRPITAGDVIVLVRKRSGFVAAMGAALRDAGLPVAGADRLVITDHIAVQDLMALGRTVSNAEDELSLAAVLKSPLFGFSDDDLMALALSRDQKRPESLYFALRRLARPRGVALVPPFVPEGERARFLKLCKASFDRLEELRRRSGFDTVFPFFARILGPEGGRAALVVRLGSEAGTVVDAFLDLALAEEEAGRGGLDAFLADLEASPPEIKREMDHGRGEVRIMTAHASKGLEAPVVFLVDPGSAPFSRAHGARLMEWADMPGRPSGAAPGFLWCPEKGARNAVVERLQDIEREAAEDEYRRLLYVGLTRAADRLVVCGIAGQRGPDEASWAMRVRAALGGDGAREIRDPETGELLALRIGEEPDERIDAPALAPEPVAPVREVNMTKLDPEPLPPRPLTPSTAGGASRLEIVADADPALPGSNGRLALERGRLMHRLLQVLPELPHEERRPAARTYMERVGAAFANEEREAMLAAVEAVLDDPVHAELFSDGSRAEVTVAGEIELGGVLYAVNGAIDRLAVGPDFVHILDYKTNAPFPKSLAEVPDAMCLQLALYRELVRPLFPALEIRTSLLFTEGPLLMPVPAEALDEALAARAARAQAAAHAA
ncbi:double-strand break repair helicase AddA [Aureimonas sp. AU4]|uniref:double-strand break repair helicase AddA n=1 Tax=Aureimonas sp. AU4 TaxID=1638163 RepID=UPI000781A401|nr:double-strand break repair helicase AddA [Aureimonas sp. AU4]